MASIINGRTTAVVGVSTDHTKYGHKIFKTLKLHKVKSYAVGKNGGEVAGSLVYKDLSDLPEVPAFVIMVIPPAAAKAVMETIVKLGIKDVWFQPGSASDDAVKYGQANGVTVHSGSCIMVKEGYW